VFIEEYDFLFPEAEFLKAPITIIASLESAEEEEGNAWEGKIGALKTFLGKQLKQQEEGAQKERKQIEEKQERGRQETEKKMEQLKSEMKEMKSEMKEMKEQVKGQMKEIKEDIKEEVVKGQVRIEERMKEMLALLMG